jgi:glycosyltransferase involved in cell wall biosynthesis
MILFENAQQLSVIHIITGLNDGGAEAVLYRLCRHNLENRHSVISLTSKGKYGSMLEAVGVRVIALNMSPGRPSPIAFIRLVKLLRKANPDVVQTWMYHGDLFGGLAARVAGIRSVFWGIRHTNLESGKSKKTTILIAKVLAKLSWWLPIKIVVCAQRAMQTHESMGYDRRKMRFIPNGYDLEDFKPGLDPQGKLNASLVPEAHIPLIGTVGRFDLQKDHCNLIEALAILRDRIPKFRCVLVGTGLDSSNAQVLELIAQRDLASYVELLGRRNDIPNIMNALDLHVLPSASEAFPNVVAEAMACGTPCVVTDVGDAAYIVGDTGWVVPPRDPMKLAEAIAAAVQQKFSDPAGWRRRCQASRDRIKNNFDIQTMVKKYQEVWSSD